MAMGNIDGYLSRIFYAAMAVVFLSLIVVSCVSLGYFAHQHEQQVDFWNEFVAGDETACVLYGRRFPEWELLFCVFLLIIGALVWMVMSLIFLIIGKPGMTSKFSILDAAMGASFALLSLIVSLVITVGLDSTCRQFRASSVLLDMFRCKAFFFVDFRGASTELLSFFGDIEIAKNTSWAVTVYFVCLLALYLVLMMIGFWKDSRSESADVTSSNGKAASTTAEEGYEDPPPANDTNPDDEQKERDI